MPTTQHLMVKRDNMVFIITGKRVNKTVGTMGSEHFQIQNSIRIPSTYPSAVGLAISTNSEEKEFALFH